LADKVESERKKRGVSGKITKSTRILIVSEDNEFNDSSSAFLSKFGYTVGVAGDIETVKACFKEGAPSINILLVDLYISFDDPLEVMSYVRREMPGVEIVAVCYPDDTGKIMESQVKGKVNGILPKSAGIPEMFEDMIGALASKTFSGTDESARLRELESAMEVAHVLSAPSLDLQQKLDICLGIVLKHFEAGRGSILIVDEKADELEIVANSRRELVGVRVPLNDISVVSWVARNKRPLNVGDLSNVEEFDFQKSSEYKRDPFLSFPIISEDKLLGVFNITDKESGLFKREDEVALGSFLDRIAVTMDNALLVDSVRLEREKLRIANKELKKLEELKNNLVSMLVHDLKGPIGEVMANLSLLEEAELKDFEKDTLLIARAGIDNLQGMVMDILDVNRMEEGKFHLNYSSIDMRDIAKKKIEMMDGLMKMDNKRIVMQETGSNFIAKLDASIISRVLANLVTNANNYTPDGGKITIRVEDIGPNKIRVGVQDEGPGVPEEFKEIIFMKFGQVKGDQRRSKYSTGLGLTFCKMAMDAHGGEIWVEDAPEIGSIFYFTLNR